MDLLRPHGSPRRIRLQLHVEKACRLFLKAADIGENPLTDSREPGHPVGLKVCQIHLIALVSVTIKYRCGSKTYRFVAVYIAESPIFQLQVTFAAMQESTQSAFNPVKLVESLKLRTSEQQDAQEFSKLFMAHLDTEFAKQSDPGLKTLISDQGKQSYCTICEKCQHRSERDSDFLEIEVNIKEAKRYTELKELPPVVHFSLLRFVYDLASMERKKSKHTISFPTFIDMDRFLGPPEERKQRGKQNSGKSKNLYELRGVLLHKGASAYHGHYEAQVFDLQNKAWYQFNDETVTKIDSLEAKPNTSKDKPKAEADSKGKKANGHSQQQPKKRRRVDSDSDIEIIEFVSSPPAPKGTSAPENTAYISSKEAYMLVYSRIDDNRKAEMKDCVAGQSCGGGLKMRAATPDALTPPHRAQQAVSTLNDAHQEACKAFVQRERETIARFDEIRNRMREVYKSWNITLRDQQARSESPNGVHHADKADDTKTSEASVPAEQQTNVSDLVSDITPREQVSSISEIVCSHGKLDPDKGSDMKLITKIAYERIATEDHYGWNPVLSPADVCELCVKNMFTVGEDDPGFWVSKQWLKDWRLTKPKMHSASQGDLPPDAAEFVQHVRCEHGGLSANVTARRKISPEIPNRVLSAKLSSTFQKKTGVNIEDRRKRRSYSAGPLIAVENTGGRMDHDIAICQDCRLKRKSDFDMTEITVRILGAKDPIPTSGSCTEESVQVSQQHLGPRPITTYGSRKAGGLRQSNRIRQGRQVKQRRVTITKAMTVKDLKVSLQEELNVPVISQRLFYRGAELEDSSATVLSLGILANDFLDLREQTEDIDLLSDTDNERDKRKRRKEGPGFGGTLLSILNTYRVKATKAIGTSYICNNSELAVMRTSTSLDNGPTMSTACATADCVATETSFTVTCDATVDGEEGIPDDTAATVRTTCCAAAVSAFDCDPEPSWPSPAILELKAWAVTVRTCCCLARACNSGPASLGDATTWDWAS
ncbi:hypothetical protein IEO21_01585 [Rhodonia placenta]|uniref:Ubiquitinyl hydrolase 1 n=1 Tax=Rhodonia placenta TaxID=104341 RepID=A0A8H7P9D9_9APHY|nr:hypothetical protein IEO21_01585 [Postia placenta]